MPQAEACAHMRFADTEVEGAFVVSTRADPRTSADSSRVRGAEESSRSTASTWSSCRRTSVTASARGRSWSPLPTRAACRGQARPLHGRGRLGCRRRSSPALADVPRMGRGRALCDGATRCCSCPRDARTATCPWWTSRAALSDLVVLRADAASGVRFDDPAFGIAWPAEVAVVSERDRVLAVVRTTPRIRPR